MPAIKTVALVTSDDQARLEKQTLVASFSNHSCHPLSLGMKFHLLCNFSCQRKHPRSARDVRPPDYLCNNAFSACRGQCCHNKVGKCFWTMSACFRRCPFFPFFLLPGGMLIKYMQMTLSPPWKMLMWILCDCCCEAHVMRKVTFFCPAGSRAAGFRLLRRFVNALCSDQSVNKYYKIWIQSRLQRRLCDFHWRERLESHWKKRGRRWGKSISNCEMFGVLIVN